MYEQKSGREESTRPISDPEVGRISLVYWLTTSLGFGAVSSLAVCHFRTPGQLFTQSIS